MKYLALPALLLSQLSISCQQVPPSYPKPVIVTQPAVVATPFVLLDPAATNDYGYPQGSYQGNVAGADHPLNTSNPNAAFDQVAQQYAQEANSQTQQTNSIPLPPQQNSIAAPYNPQLIEQPNTNSNVGLMDYKVKITNDTPSRIFVEAQDAAGNIYPCGAMAKGQSQTTAMTQSAPAKGPILIVVRDPDQPGAPELRRYRVATPNASYANRTLHITIIPKGRYSAAIDDAVYYMSASED